MKWFIVFALGLSACVAQSKDIVLPYSGEQVTVSFNCGQTVEKHIFAVEAFGDKTTRIKIRGVERFLRDGDYVYATVCGQTKRIGTIRFFATGDAVLTIKNIPFKTP